MPTCEFILENGYECETRIEEGNVCWAHEGHKCKVQKCRVLKVRDCNDFCLSHYKQWMNEMADKAKEIEKEQKQKEKEKAKKEKEEARAEKAAAKKDKPKKLTALEMKMEVMKTQQYIDHKKIFEAKYFKILNKWHTRDMFGKLVKQTEKEVSTSNDARGPEMFIYESEDQRQTYQFWDVYDKDPKQCEFMGLCNDPDNKIEGALNEWRGFAASRKEYEINEELIKPIIKHVKNIAGEDDDGYELGINSSFIMSWLAWIVQNPKQKTEVGLIFRDVSTMFDKQGGTGKSLFWEKFIHKMVFGSDYSYKVDDNKRLYDKFNSSFENKFFVLVEELASKVNKDNEDVLKNIITADSQSIEKKGDDLINDSADCRNFVCNTNHRSPVYIDRRWAVFDTNKKIQGDMEYFNNLGKIIAKPETAYNFYMYLKDYKTYTSHNELGKNIPKTEARREMLYYTKLAKNPVMCWLANEEFISRTHPKTKSSDLYSLFENWAIRYIGRCNFTIREFGIRMTEAANSGAFVKDSKTSQYTLNRVELLRMLNNEECFNIAPIFNFSVEEVKKLEELNLKKFIGVENSVMGG